MFFLVVLFRFLEVLKLVLRQETRLSLQGSPLFPSFFMLYFIEGNVLFNFGGKFVVESALDFFSILCYTCLCLCLCFVSHMS